MPGHGSSCAVRSGRSSDRKSRCGPTGRGRRCTCTGPCGWRTSWAWPGNSTPSDTRTECDRATGSFSPCSSGRNDRPSICARSGTLHAASVQDGRRDVDVLDHLLDSCAGLDQARGVGQHRDADRMLERISFVVEPVFAQLKTVVAHVDHQRVVASGRSSSRYSSTRPRFSSSPWTVSQ